MNYLKYLGVQLTKPAYYISLKKECCREPNELVVNHVQRTKKSIIACVYKYDNIYVHNAFKDALTRGIELTLIMDYKQNKQNKLVDELKVLGANVKLWKKTEKLHAKFLIFDDAHVLTGSFNLTMPDTDKSDHHKVDLIILLSDFNAILNFQNIYKEMMHILSTDVCDVCDGQLEII